MQNKKSYMAPLVKEIALNAQEATMTTPDVSDTGYGWDDQGPVGAVSGDL